MMIKSVLANIMKTVNIEIALIVIKKTANYQLLQRNYVLNVPMFGEFAVNPNGHKNLRDIVWLSITL